MTPCHPTQPTPNTRLADALAHLAIPQGSLAKHIQSITKYYNNCTTASQHTTHPTHPTLTTTNTPLPRTRTPLLGKGPPIPPPPRSRRHPNTRKTSRRRTPHKNRRLRTRLLPSSSLSNSSVYTPINRQPTTKAIRQTHGWHAHAEGASMFRQQRTQNHHSSHHPPPLLLFSSSPLLLFSSSLFSSRITLSLSLHYSLSLSLPNSLSFSLPQFFHVSSHFLSTTLPPHSPYLAPKGAGLATGEDVVKDVAHPWKKLNKQTAPEGEDSEHQTILITNQLITNQSHHKPLPLQTNLKQTRTHTKSTKAQELVPGLTLRSPSKPNTPTPSIQNTSTTRTNQMTKPNIPPLPSNPAVTAADRRSPQPFTFFSRDNKERPSQPRSSFSVGPTLNRAAALLALCKHASNTTPTH